MISTLISYCREDSEFASRLAADLRAAGTGAVLAPLDGSPDERGHNAAKVALARCTDWLVVLSPSAVRSASLNLDVAVAVGREIPIVAILRHDCQVPARLQHLEPVDFRTDYAGGLRRLLTKVASASAQGRPADNHSTLYIPTGRGTTAEPRRPARGDPDARRSTSGDVRELRAAMSPGESVREAKLSAGRSHSGRPLRLLGGALLAVSIMGFVGVSVVAGSALDSATAWGVMGVGLLLVFLAAFTGVKLLKRGKQSDALSAEAALAQDARAPVVYLRSFQDDAVAGEGSLAALPLGGGFLVGGMVAMLDLAGGVASEEEQLAEALHTVGPFVAVGKPGESLPQLGAARMYVQDSEWREVVRALMSRAGLVVLRAGRTDGLWWEVQTAAEIVEPERIVLLLPYERDQYELFRYRAAAIFRRGLPDYPAGNTKGFARSVRGIVYFESDWTPHFRQAEELYRTAKPWLQAYKMMLQPVFKQLGVEVKIPKASVWKVLMLIVVVPIVAVIGTLVVMALIGAVISIFN